MKDPYNPADAIFTAARYLQAAGASKNLSQAIFAYNHAGWYVQSVLLRAQLIGGMPKGVHRRADRSGRRTLPGRRARQVRGRLRPQTRQDAREEGSNAAVTVASNSKTTGTAIYAKQGSPVIAANDGKIVKIGTSQKLGTIIELQDATGNTYTYANLGSIPAQYPVPKPVSVSSTSIAKALLAPASSATKQPATAGSQSAASTVSTAKAASEAKNAPISLSVAPATSGTRQSSKRGDPVRPHAVGHLPARHGRHAGGE